MSLPVLPSKQFDRFSLKDGISSDVSNFKDIVENFPSQFYIQGERDKKLFLHEETHRDNEGDITHVTYFHPGDARVPRVTLFND
jgi:hypothetical protein